MLKFVGYIFLFLLIMTFAIVFKIITVYEINKTKKFFKIEFEKVRVTRILREKQKTFAEIKNELTKFPLLFDYLNQVNIILEKYSYEFKNLQIITFRDKQLKNSDFDGARFCEEYKNASEKIRKEVRALSDVLGVVYSWEHPFKYKLGNFKKNIMLQILTILLKQLEKRIKNEERRKRIEQEKVGTDCNYLPVSI